MWGAELPEAMPGADHDAVIASDSDSDSDSALLHWLRLLRDTGVAVLRGTPRESR